MATRPLPRRRHPEDPIRGHDAPLQGDTAPRTRRFDDWSQPMHFHCAHDPGLLLFTYAHDDLSPDTRHDRLAAAIATLAGAAWLGLMALAMLG